MVVGIAEPVVSVPESVAVSEIASAGSGETVTFVIGRRLRGTDSPTPSPELPNPTPTMTMIKAITMSAATATARDRRPTRR